MIDKETRKRIIALIHQEVVPAIGADGMGITDEMVLSIMTQKK